MANCERSRSQLPSPPQEPVVASLQSTSTSGSSSQLMATPISSLRVTAGHAVPKLKTMFTVSSPLRSNSQRDPTSRSNTLCIGVSRTPRRHRVAPRLPRRFDGSPAQAFDRSWRFGKTRQRDQTATGRREKRARTLQPWHRWSGSGSTWAGLAASGVLALPNGAVGEWEYFHLYYSEFRPCRIGN